MRVGDASFTPVDANTSNMDGTESNSSSSTSSSSSASSPATQSESCLDGLDNVGNAVGDFADNVRDFFTGEASGRDVWDGYKDIAVAGGQAIEDCVEEVKSDY
jgi:hypothetical protein